MPILIRHSLWHRLGLLIWAHKVQERWLKLQNASTQQARSRLTIANQELNKTQDRLDQLNQAIKDVNAEIAASDIQPDVVKTDGKKNGGGTLTEGRVKSEKRCVG